LLAWLLSTNRKAIRWQTAGWGLGLQWIFAVLVLRFDAGERALAAVGDAVNRMLAYAFVGSGFVFGDLGKQHSSFGIIFAFQVLPTIIFISAFFAVLYHLGIMQIVIKAAARLMQWTMGISGAESLNVAASIFMGQTEAPLSIRPFLPGATQSELMTIMTSGMAHVSGGIMALLVPETHTPATIGRVTMPINEEHREENLVGAIARGTIDGGRLAFNVGIMLISFLALIGLLNGMLGGIHNWLGGHHVPFPSSLNVILGFVFAPVAWLIGIPWHSAHQVGNLLGTRTVTNELVAYALLGAQKSSLDFRSFTITTFALCGFANFSSIGMQIGGIGALAPNRRNDLARLGLRAMLAGTMANLMSASIVSVLLR
jgi:CNT family concentrative nucleoside transporter